MRIGIPNIHLKIEFDVFLFEPHVASSQKVLYES